VGEISPLDGLLPLRLTERKVRFNGAGCSKKGEANRHATRFNYPFSGRWPRLATGPAAGYCPFEVYMTGRAAEISATFNLFTSLQASAIYVMANFGDEGG
jgi:hypothetical protein